MQWQLSKHWQVPISDSRIQLLTRGELRIYSALINKDHELKAEQTRDQIEYLAMFSNYEAVEKLRQSRDLKNNQSANDIFEQQLIQEFGKGLTNNPATEEENPNIDEIRVVKREGSN